MTIRHISAVVAGSLIGLWACSANPLAVSGDSSQTLALGVGRQLNLTVGTVGPGSYQTPTIAGRSVAFLGDSIVGPATPAGPRQLFRFKGVVTGTSIIVLTHSGNEPTITDTIVVR